MLPIVLVEIEEGGRLVLNVRKNDGSLVRIDQNDVVRNVVYGGSTYEGVTSTFVISNYHFSDTYVVSTDNGTVSIENDTIQYTPATHGFSGFYLNGSFQSVIVLENKPIQPTIDYPIDSSIGVLIDASAQSSAFTAANPSLVHVSTQWQIATDPEFLNIVMDVTTTDLEEIPMTGITYQGWYYLRCRHIAEY